MIYIFKRIKSLYGILVMKKYDVKYFTKDNGTILPVSIEKYLLTALSKTTTGTSYRDPPPDSEITERQLGRILLQVHQILDIFKSLGISTKNKNFLDIGTGNGMIPRLILELSDLKEAVGSDPFLDGEHRTSWQNHDHDKTLINIRSYIKENLSSKLDYEKYSIITNHENSNFIPQKINIPSYEKKNYKFKKLGIHNIDEIGEKFDLVYCKAIEHISNLNDAFSSLSKVSKDNSFFYIKHRSFFSYLGPHRYSSIGIPWGHLLLNDKEYKRFVSEFHPERMEQMCDFYFNDLTYPRISVSEILKIANNFGFHLEGLKIEPPRYRDKVFGYSRDIKDFWKILNQNYPSISSEEVFSGIIHIVLKKV